MSKTSSALRIYWSLRSACEGRRFYVFTPGQLPVELAGIIVRVFPKDLDAIRSQLTSLQGVEVHHATADGRLIVTIEQPTHRQLAAHLTRIQDIDRLLSLSMVYQYSDESVADRCESDDDADQSKSCQLEHSNAQETST